MNASADMPILMSLFWDGYGDVIVRALDVAFEEYGNNVGKGEAFNGTDGENVYLLVALVRAILCDTKGQPRHGPVAATH